MLGSFSFAYNLGKLTHHSQIEVSAGQEHQFPLTYSVYCCFLVKQLQLWSGGLGRSVAALKSDEVSSYESCGEVIKNLAHYSFPLML